MFRCATIAFFCVAGLPSMSLAQDAATERARLANQRIAAEAAERARAEAEVRHPALFTTPELLAPVLERFGAARVSLDARPLHQGDRKPPPTCWPHCTRNRTCRCLPTRSLVSASSAWCCIRIWPVAIRGSTSGSAVPPPGSRPVPSCECRFTALITCTGRRWHSSFMLGCSNSSLILAHCQPGLLRSSSASSSRDCLLAAEA